MLRRFAAYLLCAFMWLASAYVFANVAIRSYQGESSSIPVVGNLLNQPLLADRAAPIAVLLLFGWILLDLLLHFLRVMREVFAVTHFRTITSGSAVSQDRFRRFAGPTRAARRAGILSQTADRRALNESLPSMGALDAAAVDGCYSSTRVYIWILPVIGFIGTAVGMSDAIRGFAVALRDNLDIPSMTARLSQFVIPGLASAFGTTILALLAAIVSHFCASVLNAAEHDALGDLDRACISYMARLPHPPAPIETLATLVGSLTQAVQRLTATCADVSNAAQSLQAATGDLRAASIEMKRAATAPYHVTVTRQEPRQ